MLRTWFHVMLSRRPVGVVALLMSAAAQGHDLYFDQQYRGGRVRIVALTMAEFNGENLIRLARSFLNHPGPLEKVIFATGNEHLFGMTGVSHRRFKHFAAARRRDAEQAIYVAELLVTPK